MLVTLTVDVLEAGARELKFPSKGKCRVGSRVLTRSIDGEVLAERRPEMITCAILLFPLEP